MGNYWMDEGENDVAQVYLKDSARTLYIGLFTAPIEGSLVETDGLADIVEVTPESAGYARQALNAADWTLVGSSATNLQKTFDIATEVTVKGYFITDISVGVSGGQLLGMFYFTSGDVTVPAGEQIKITPTITVA